MQHLSKTFNQHALHLLKASTKKPIVFSSRGAAGRWREINGLPRRFASGPLVESPEWSYVDGRGPAPLGSGQRRRHLESKKFTETIVKVMKQHIEARRLVSDKTPKIQE